MRSSTPAKYHISHAWNANQDSNIVTFLAREGVVLSFTQPRELVHMTEAANNDWERKDGSGVSVGNTQMGLTNRLN